MKILTMPPQNSDSIDKVEFVQNHLASDAERHIYDSMVAQYAQTSAADLADAVKKAYRDASTRGVAGGEVPNANATSAIVNLVLDAEKKKMLKGY